ncbi:forkhead box protein H1 [Ictalurus punctatus]|uniref:Forkhead box protein H1 n=1 Tax=Ictalurus punctatus TaxID=7998 RepID=A0A2D0S9F2_ICTPU|nr:forkhead box protein H1 [Ictalurus punctatus]XP_017338860.1 forkhead box protein H1 [Ictalurus punctatus]
MTKLRGGAEWRGALSPHRESGVRLQISTLPRCTGTFEETLRTNSGVMDGVFAQPSRAMGSVLPQLTGPEEKPVPGLMDAPRAGTHGASRLPADQHAGEYAPNACKKKNYQRYPKPPYSYLAMIAMVIQNSPQKKLTLSQILKEISTLFPFFKGNYKGWRDSVRHNLSSYDCFIKVLKDPGKPQGKGNFWAVEVSRVPLELLKRQNTAVSRQDETIFAQDLAPYILQGHTPALQNETQPAAPSRRPSPTPEDLYRPKLDSSFAIDSLLHSFRSADVLRGRSDGWGAEPNHCSPRPRYMSANRSASASSASPASSSSSDEDWRGLTRFEARKRGTDGGPNDYFPPSKMVKRGASAPPPPPPPWELPTSYAKYTPPNAVAPPSMRFSTNPFVPLGSVPFYSHHITPNHFGGRSYWPLLSGGRVSLQAPPLLMDLDSMLQSVPPNKSVFDVHTPPNQYGPPFSKYS